ncbi:10657_t:CDS:2 [Acaulospora morrowiae]|uniref:10657_t:CDS:1 n=1 Tax=Acaulospora morrowiae TaxID=94023 RepID=A0A9N8WBC3_9GLOM|nr:10657_t:CDS:2 [Acaulospora morrowiae]
MSTLEEYTFFFQFRMKNIHKMDEPLYSRPFSHNYLSEKVWRLIIEPANELLLITLQLVMKPIVEPSDLETCSIDIVLKNLDGKEVEAIVVDNNDTFRIYNKRMLDDTILVGVHLCVIESDDEHVIRPTKHIVANKIPRDLATVWAEELLNPATANVRFKVRDRYIYASSSILSKRSQYFQVMLEGNWTECRYSRRNTSFNSTQSLYSSQSSELSSMDDRELLDLDGTRKFEYEIEITDFAYTTVLQMLKFIYTGQLTIGCWDNIWDIYSIADKYLITDLKDVIKRGILEEIKVENAAEILYGKAWRWPDLKESIMEYTIRNFPSIRKTEGYNRIVKNQSEYPMFLELNSDILLAYFNNPSN